jgi:hypothetical protein
MSATTDSPADRIGPAEAAAILHVSTATINRMADRGLFGPIERTPLGQHRRILRANVERFAS